VPPITGVTDTHAHVWWKSFDEDRDEVLRRARAAGVERLVLVGTDLESSRAAFALAERAAREEPFSQGAWPAVHPTAGIHPHDAHGVDEAMRRELAALARRPDCVAVGETGLDFFKQHSAPAAQEASFRWHLELARALAKPVVIHCREAHERTLALLREARGAGGPVAGVMHCYTMGPEELPAYLELGLYISFSGVVTYPRNEQNREAARAVPAERLLVETDCPFLAPQSRRGRRNEPANVVEVLERVAEVRGEPAAALAHTTSANAARLFGLA
jgi:TatD DNase family protein